jgi:hypothetical protein
MPFLHVCCSCPVSSQGGSSHGGLINGPQANTVVMLIPASRAAGMDLSEHYGSSSRGGSTLRGPPPEHDRERQASSCPSQLVGFQPVKIWVADGTLTCCRATRDATAEMVEHRPESWLSIRHARAVVYSAATERSACTRGSHTS